MTLAAERSTAPEIRNALIAAIPKLRAFAISLCGNSDRADDLVQETLVKAWTNIASFTAGTNMPAWLFTILRNIFYSDYRKRRREVDDPDGEMASPLHFAQSSESHGFSRFQRRLDEIAGRSARGAHSRRRFRHGL